LSKSDLSDFDGRAEHLRIAHASRIALSPAGEGITGINYKFAAVRGWLSGYCHPRIEPLIRQPSAATFSRKGRSEDTLTPGAHLNELKQKKLAIPRDGSHSLEMRTNRH
jgi:hypothetical protein